MISLSAKRRPTSPCVGGRRDFSFLIHQHALFLQFAYSHPNLCISKHCQCKSLSMVHFCKKLNSCRDVTVTEPINPNAIPLFQDSTTVTAVTFVAPEKQYFLRVQLVFKVCFVTDAMIKNG